MKEFGDWNGIFNAMTKKFCYWRVYPHAGHIFLLGMFSCSLYCDERHGMDSLDDTTWGLDFSGV